MDKTHKRFNDQAQSITLLPEKCKFPACQPSTRCSDLPGAPPKVVLLVEDETMVAMTQQLLVERIGWQVLIASCAREALAYLLESTRQICMVLMDMDLPDIPGTELFAMIRDIRPGIKVVICSGDTRADEVQTLLASGAAGFLQKPFGIQQLKMALNGQLPLEAETVWAK